MTKQEFKMVDSRTPEGLETGVNEMLDQGWQLHGVTMMAVEPGRLGTAGMTCRFVQALVRDAEDERATRRPGMGSSENNSS